MKRTLFSMSPLMNRLAVMAVGFAMIAAFVPQATAANAQAESYYAQGMTAYEQKALLRATELFKKATDADPDYVDAWFNLGAVHYKMDKYEQARYAFQKALWRSPADHEVRYNLALAQVKLGMNNDALANLERIPTGHAKFKEAAEQIATLKKGGATSTVATSTTPKSTTQPSSTATGTAMDANASGVYAKGLVGPTGLTVGPAGELYVANYTKNSVVKILPNGNSSTLIQGGPINGPIGMVRDPRNGNLYIANYISGDIVTVAPNGSTNTLKRGYGKPYYLYFDAATNRLFVSEQEGNRVSVLKL